MSFNLENSRRNDIFLFLMFRGAESLDLCRALEQKFFKILIKKGKLILN